MSNLGLFRRADDAVSFAAGQTIFHAGDPGKAMFVVLEGQVSILLGSTVIEDVPPGSFFGELALIDHDLRSATAVAKTDCKLVPVDKKRFTFLVQEHPYFSLEVMKTLARRLRHMDSQMGASSPSQPRAGSHPG